MDDYVAPAFPVHVREKKKKIPRDNAYLLLPGPRITQHGFTLCKLQICCKMYRPTDCSRPIFHGWKMARPFMKHGPPRKMKFNISHFSFFFFAFFTLCFLKFHYFISQRGCFVVILNWPTRFSRLFSVLFRVFINLEGWLIFIVTARRNTHATFARSFFHSSRRSSREIFISFAWKIHRFIVARWHEVARPSFYPLFQYFFFFFCFFASSTNSQRVNEIFTRRVL